MSATYAMESVITFGLGVLVGTVEVVSRYRDNPRDALVTPGASLYLLINGVAAAVALYLTYAFGLFSEADAKSEALRVATAGLGAMAFFRTSIFTVRVADQDLAVGPGSFLQLLLTAIDRGVDRSRAQSRAAAAVEIMNDVSFDLAHTALPTFCLSLMQSLPAEDQASLGQQVNALRAATTIDDKTKALILGVTLMNFVGTDVVRVAVSKLGVDILSSPGSVISSAPHAASRSVKVAGATEAGAIHE